MVLPTDVTLDALCGTWKIHQRQRGHRWSADDLVTAYVACQWAPNAQTHLDLGCGIGSVLMLCAYKLATARSVGVEAQEQSAQLCQASLELNQLVNRVHIRCEDFRTGGLASSERFDLVTGSPPYLPLGTATVPRDAQRAAARIELRGGVEAYCLVGAAHLAAGGCLVLCGDGRRPQRTREAARLAGLHIRHVLQFVPLEGRAPLFHVMVMQPTPGPCTEEVVTARNPHRQRTEQMQAIRRFFDMPRAADDAPSLSSSDAGP